MATTSTVPAVLDAALPALDADLPGGVKTYEAWPGPDAAPEMVVLGAIEWAEYEIASLKTGRQHRQEDWSVGFEVFVAGRTGTTPSNVKPVRDRAFAITTSLEDVFADNPKVGITTGGWAAIRLTEAGPRVFPEEKAWAYRVAGRIHVSQRLT